MSLRELKKAERQLGLRVILRKDVGESWQA
jgi:hypothetical protein